VRGVKRTLTLLFENLRYVVLGIFDGVLTALGVVIASYYSGSEIEQAIKAGLAGGLAVALSNGFGAFFAEEAEMGKRVKMLERGLFRDLKDTVIYERFRRTVRLSLVTHSLSTLFGTLLLLGVFYISGSVYVTTGAMLAVLFLLGCFIGKWGYSSFVISGVKLVVIGAFVFIVSLFLGSF